VSSPDPRLGAAVLQPLPRRERIGAASDESLPVPKQVTLAFKAGLGRSLGRLLEWFVFGAGVVVGNVLDRLSGRSTVERRAVRLRRAIERAGGTFIKFGQQIAMRIDLVPWEYCVELSKLLDRMPAFPLPHALAAVERSTGRPWHETFAVFDPEPVGSASIACVYQAMLKDGTKVAVKIRRPDVGEVFMADFRVLDWVFGATEFLAIIRPGTTVNIRRELKETLLSELDFTREARYQHIFRINAASKASKRFLTAPRAYLDLSNDEVLIQEFVSGMWLWEIVAAIEQQDPEGLAMMQRLNIDPSLVGRRILWASFWGGEENTFFHADPHPANIVVGRDSTLTFVDFGSCGSFDNDQKWAFEQIALSFAKGDAEGMARAGLKLFEPFPPVDLSQLMKDTEVEYLRAIFTFRAKAKYTQWWERTSATQWLASIKIARRYNLPLSLGTLRMIRATLLYDTLALRLDHTIDRFKEYGKFRKWRARFVRARWNRRVRRAVTHPFALAESIGQAGEDAMALAQHTVRSPVLTFTAAIGKWAFAFTVISRLIATALVVTGVPVAMLSLAASFRGDASGLTSIVWTSLTRVVRHYVYQAVIAGAVIVHVRQIVLRLMERDSTRDEARRP
jgi:predicted unusual protein kinase regulating ubiquinone biosynthesis (AarF/ABC1/UbiB family)